MNDEFNKDIWWINTERFIYFFGSIAVLGGGIYLLTIGDVTNALSAFILSCVAYNQHFQMVFFKLARVGFLEILKKRG